MLGKLAGTGNCWHLSGARTWLQGGSYKRVSRKSHTRDLDVAYQVIGRIGRETISLQVMVMFLLLWPFLLLSQPRWQSDTGTWRLADMESQREPLLITYHGWRGQLSHSRLPDLAQDNRWRESDSTPELWPPGDPGHLSTELPNLSEEEEETGCGGCKHPLQSLPWTRGSWGMLSAVVVASFILLPWYDPLLIPRLVTLSLS